METWKLGNSLGMTGFLEFPNGNRFETMETPALLNFTNR